MKAFSVMLNAVLLSYLPLPGSLLHPRYQTLTPSKSGELRLGLQTSGRGFTRGGNQQSLGDCLPVSFMSFMLCTGQTVFCDADKEASGWRQLILEVQLPQSLSGNPEGSEVNASAHLHLFLKHYLENWSFCEGQPKTAS